MDDELELFTNPMSRGRVARWVLEEVGRPYRATVLDYEGAMRAPDFLRLNPMGKVPVLRHGATVVTELAAICAYLADRFPEAGLAPSPGSDARGPYLRWLFFAAGPLEAACTNRALGVETSPEQRRMAGYGSHAQVMDTLDAALGDGEDFLAGNRFTAADLYLGAHLGWGLSFGTVEPRPAFQLYWSRLQARPAHQRAAALDDALLAAAGQPPPG